MRILGFSRHAFTSCAAAAMLAGCGGSQPPIGVPGATPKTSAPATHAERGKSWMLPEAKSDNLLYVSDSQSDAITVYSFPKVELVGSITLKSPAYGLCTNKSGDLFVSDFFGQNTLEFSHGGTTPINTLPDAGAPFGCAIDPTTGNLAVTNYCDGPVGSCSGHGTVLIYHNARGNAEVLHDTFGGYMYYCNYDKAGNLFVDGQARFFKMSFAELSKGGASFQQIDLKLPQKPQSPGFMQWVSNTLYVAAADADTIYAYNLKGEHAKRVGAIRLKGMSATGGTNQFLIAGSRVIAPNLENSQYPSGSVELYHYPAGGAPTAGFAKSVDFPEAVVLSRGG